MSGQAKNEIRIRAPARFEVWKNYLVQLGYGYRLGVDLPRRKPRLYPQR